MVLVRGKDVTDVLVVFHNFHFKTKTEAARIPDI